MEPADWENGWMRTLGMFLRGDAPEIRDNAGKHIDDDDFLLLFNAHDKPVCFRLPDEMASASWKIVFDTARPKLPIGSKSVQKPGTITLVGRSFILLGHER